VRKQTLPFAAAFVMVLAAIMPRPAGAQRVQLIRDAEIENTIRTYATPLFQAAGLSPKDINVFLVDNPSLNAFVTPGLRMFIHTGLLMRTDDPLEVIGVIAHETGHLAAGHTATRGGPGRTATSTVIASYILGLGAALATGRPELAQAAILGGQDIALKGLLRYSRSQESAADQFAVKILNGTGQSARGLLDFLRILNNEEVLFSNRQSPYLRTHPVTANRVTFLEDQVAKSPYGNRRASPALEAMHARLRAKLFGFLTPLDQVLRRYPESDTSLPARYARAIALFRAGDSEAALAATDALISENPRDAYFREFKGQVLFDIGKIAQAVAAYEAASRLLPNSSQIHLALAQARIELDDPAADRAALNDLALALRDEPGNGLAWRLRAVAYGRQGQVGMTALALAEQALAGRKPKEARDQAVRAQKILQEGTPAWLRARDIEELAKRRVDKESKN